eukprot:TRINITY_DN3189_c0_g2_i2.p1 TRINITY_DN3189_c0_g2~~TRINITY_DN3189_c0_g2_i2.p1  ORF type:complete len:375 (-),score=72.10 TRINITY_DN3189_c0_g2_i2:130-1254(-)
MDVKQSVPLASHYYRLAADRGHLMAMNNLGCIIFNQRTTSDYRERYMEIMDKAAEYLPLSMINRTYDPDQSKEKRLELLERAAERSLDGVYELTRLLWRNLNVVSADERVEELLEVLRRERYAGVHALDAIIAWSKADYEGFLQELWMGVHREDTLAMTVLSNTYRSHFDLVRPWLLSAPSLPPSLHLSGEAQSSLSEAELQEHFEEERWLLLDRAFRAGDMRVVSIVTSDFLPAHGIPLEHLDERRLDSICKLDSEKLRFALRYFRQQFVHTRTPLVLQRIRNLMFAVGEVWSIENHEWFDRDTREQIQTLFLCEACLKGAHSPAADVQMQVQDLGAFLLLPHELVLCLCRQVASFSSLAVSEEEIESLYSSD